MHIVRFVLDMDSSRMHPSVAPTPDLLSNERFFACSLERVTSEPWLVNQRPGIGENSLSGTRLPM